MNAHATINAALASRGMMSMDGFCQCERCGVAGLNRDQLFTMKEGRDHIGKMYCEYCQALTFVEIDNPPVRKSPPACPTAKASARPARMTMCAARTPPTTASIARR